MKPFFVLLVTLLAVNNLLGQAVYQRVGQIIQLSTVGLDFDSDLTTDAYITHFYNGSSYVSKVGVYGNRLNNRIIGTFDAQNYNFVTPIDSAALIGGRSGVQGFDAFADCRDNESILLDFNVSTGYKEGAWSKTTKYVGLEFRTRNNSRHYAFLRLQLDSIGSRILLSAFGWQQQPDSAITAVYFPSLSNEPVGQLTSSDLRIFPNPISKDFPLTVVATLATERQLTWQIYNMMGQVVKTGVYETSSGNNQLQFELEALGLEAGLYSIKLKSDTGQQAVSKVLIQQ